MRTIEIAYAYVERTPENDLNVNRRDYPFTLVWSKKGSGETQRYYYQNHDEAKSAMARLNSDPANFKD
jgi:hypothetical protein